MRGWGELSRPLTSTSPLTLSLSKGEDRSLSQLTPRSHIETKTGLAQPANAAAKAPPMAA